MINFNKLLSSKVISDLSNEMNYIRYFAALDFIDAKIYKSFLINQRKQTKEYPQFLFNSKVLDFFNLSKLLRTHNVSNQIL